MPVTTMPGLAALALLALTGHHSAVVAAAADVPPPAARSNRTSKEFQETSMPAKEPAAAVPVFKTTGRKITSDDFNTFSSLTSADIVVESTSEPAAKTVYPSLTTGPPSFVTRGRYIRNPFYFSKDDQEVEFDDDQHAEVVLNPATSKWNRYAHIPSGGGASIGAIRGGGVQGG